MFQLSALENQNELQISNIQIYVIYNIMFDEATPNDSMAIILYTANLALIPSYHNQYEKLT